MNFTVSVRGTGADNGETCVKTFITDLFRRHGVQPVA